jgi:hypothetical protein
MCGRVFYYFPVGYNKGGENEDTNLQPKYRVEKRKEICGCAGARMGHWGVPGLVCNIPTILLVFTLFLL